MDLLANLNTQQRSAVQAEPGALLVLAGPGSGKTRVLTQRIAYLIGMVGVSPYRILAVTFTNKAADEMMRRVQDFLGDQGRGLTLGTFHATCAKILRREAEYLPVDANFVIYDSDDQLTLIRRALEDLNLDEKKNRPQSLHAQISKAKNELLRPDQYPTNDFRDRMAQRVYQRYQELLLANNAVDFDDLLLYMANLLEENPQVREQYARRFEHVLVDEFQDTNMAQYTLLRHLASYHRNLFVVGDADQSIYRWRGADYRNVQRFQKDFPEAKVILLEQNYRSTQAILDTAMQVIDRNPDRIRKNLFTERGAGQRIGLYEAYDDRDEAAFVVNTIASLTKQNLARPGDFAVMYRINAQSRVLEEAFLHAGLPYKLVGAQRFYGRREIKDIVSYLRLLHNLRDEVSLTRVINVPARKIGDKTLVALRTYASNAGLAPAEVLVEMGQERQSPHRTAFSGQSLGALVNFGYLLANWSGLAAHLPPLQLMDRVLDETDYHAYIDDGTDEGRDRWENVMELRRLAAEYADQGLAAFLERVSLVSDQDTLDASASVPTLLTLHAAKGLEFSNVFIVGLNDGVLPHSRSFDEPEEMHEERRLLYVGITRARDRLYLVYSQNRSQYGYAEPVEPSRFLSDVPEGLLQTIPSAASQARPRRRRENWDDDDWDRTSRKSSSAAGDRSYASAPRPAKPVTTPAPPDRQFPAGSKVNHPVWGEGMVLNSRMDAGDELLDIYFQQVGLKRVAASLARLEKM